MVLLEFISVAWMIVVGAVIGLNAGLLMFAAGINDSACREAVRAAAAQPTPDAARNAARAAVTRFATQTNFMSSPEVQTTGTEFEYQSFLSPEGIPQRELGPYVRVTTQVRATLPVPIFFSSSGMTGRVNFKQSYTFPILNAGPRNNS